MLRLNKNKVLGLMHLAGYGTQQELADAVGVTRAWLSAMINGSVTPTTEQLVKLSQVLGATIDEISDYPKAEALVRAV